MGKDLPINSLFESDSESIEMFPCLKKRLFLKTISLILVVTFLFYELSWAGGEPLGSAKETNQILYPIEKYNDLNSRQLELLQEKELSEGITPNEPSSIEKTQPPQNPKPSPEEPLDNTSIISKISQFIKNNPIIQNTDSYLENLVNIGNYIVEGVTGFLKEITKAKDDISLKIALLINRFNPILLTTNGLTELYSYLKERATYLLNCAGEAINNFNSSIDKVEATIEAILLDAINGNLSMNKESRNVNISLYAIKEVLKSNSLDLNAYEINLDELKEINTPFISYLKNNHYVVVTNSNGLFVEYIDSNGNKIKESTDAFKEKFGGVILTQEELNKPLLSAELLKEIKGSYEGKIIVVNPLSDPKANAYSLIQNAITSATAGDTVFLKAGVYNLYWDSINMKDGVSLIGEGADKTSIIKNIGGYTGIIRAINTSNIVIKGFTIKGNPSYGRGTPRSAIIVDRSKNVLIEDNIFKDTGEWNGGAIQVGWWSGTYPGYQGMDYNVVIKNNRFIDIRDNGIHLAYAAATIIGNFFSSPNCLNQTQKSWWGYVNKSTAIKGWGTFGGIIRDNIIENQDVGLQLESFNDLRYLIDNPLIENNTIDRTAVAINSIRSNATFKNNIISHSGQIGVNYLKNTVLAPAALNGFSGNLFWANTQDWNPEFSSTYANVGTDNDFIFQDPGFKNYLAGDLTLQPLSPYINKGTPSNEAVIERNLDGTIASIIYPGGAKAYYSYYSEGKFKSVILIDETGAIRRYDYLSDGTLSKYIDYLQDGSFSAYKPDDTKIFEFIKSTGEFIDYENPPPTPANDGISLTLTTAAGDTLTYLDNTLISIRTSGGELLYNLSLDLESFQDGLITFSDGSLGILKNGEVLEIILSNGLIQRYCDSLLFSENIGGDETIYSYIKDLSHTPISAKLESEGTFIYYDGYGKLKEVIKPDGSGIRYSEDGRLFKITTETGSIYEYALIEEGSFKFSRLSKFDGLPYEEGGALSDIIPLYVKYSVSNEIVEAKNSDNFLITYSEGIISEVTSPDGVVSSYTAGAFNELGIFEELSITRNGLLRAYNQNGELTALGLHNETILFSGANISKIVKNDGTIIEDITFDAEGKILNAKITDKDLIIFIYESGIIKEIRFPDGSVNLFENGLIVKQTSKDGLIYNFTRESSGDTEITISEIDPTTPPPSDNTPIILKYNALNKLIYLKEKDNTEINYNSDGRVSTVIKGAETTYYTYETIDGKLQTEVTSPKAITIYDDAGNIIQSTINPSEGQDELEVTFNYGRIREVKNKLTGEILFNYTYEFTDSGKEVTVIEDLKANSFKRYIDEKLISVNDADGLLTEYEYDEEGRTTLSTVTRLGKVINRYTYTYDRGIWMVENPDGTTSEYQKNFKIIEDIDGVKRTYGEDDKLYFLEKEGKTYAYTYEELNGVPTGDVFQELIQVVDAYGDLIKYKKGEIVSITQPDGMVIKDLIFQDSTVSSYTIEKGGVKYFVKGAFVEKEVKEDGTTIEYYSNQWIKSLTSPSGEIENFGYEISEGKSLNLEGIKDKVDLIENASEKWLQLGTFYDPNQSLLLHLNGANGSHEALDDSGNNHSITFHGDAVLDTLTKKFGESSLKLDGTDDYLTASDSEMWDFGAGDFTIDFWVNLKSLGNSCLIGNWDDSGSKGWFFRYISTEGGLQFFYSTNGSNEYYKNFGWNPAANTWYHIALVRSGDNLKAFINGSQIDSTKDISGAAIFNANANLSVGARQTGSASSNLYLNGYLDEIRVSKGVARPIITMPETEYVNPYNTSGSFVSNPIELNSTELKTVFWNEILPEGTDITVQTRTSDDGINWGSWSDELSEPSGSLITSPPKKYLQYQVNLKTTNPDITPKLLQNPDGNFITISYTGYCNESENIGPTGAKDKIALIQNGAGLQYELLPLEDKWQKLLLHLNGESGIQQTTDASGNNHQIVFHGDAALDTLTRKFGGSSLKLDGAGDYISAADSDDFNLGANDFTLDLWANFSSHTGDGSLLNQFVNGQRGWEFKYHATHGLVFAYTQDGDNVINIKSAWTPTDGKWYHLAVVREKNILRFFVDGIQLGADQNITAVNIWNSTAPLSIGQNSGYDFFKGYLDEIRVSKGIARKIVSEPLSEYRSLYNQEGAFISNPIELNSAEFKTISWNELLPEATDITVQTRTSDDGINWGSWSDELSDPSGSQITSTPKKYFQFKVNLKTSNPVFSPKLNIWGNGALSISYFKGNVPKENVQYLTISSAGSQMRYYKDNFPAIMNSAPPLSDVNLEELNSADIPFKVLKSDDAVVSVFDKDNSLLSITRKDKSVAYYENGHIISLKDPKGAEQIHYEYDAQGNPTKITLIDARMRFKEDINTARLKVAEAKEEYLKNLAEQKSLLYQEISEKIENTRAEIQANRAELQTQLYIQVPIEHGWWIFKWVEWQTQEVPEVREALNELNAYEAQLNQDTADSYGQLDGSIESAKAQFELQEQFALDEISAQEKIYLKEILQEELTPVIFHYYRDILGRDPSTEEVDSYITPLLNDPNLDLYAPTLNIDSLKAALASSAEFALRNSGVNEIKQNVTDFINNYLAADEATKLSMLQELGLTVVEGLSPEGTVPLVIPLTYSDAQKILAYIQEQSLHFGHSAYLALGEVLKAEGIVMDAVLGLISDPGRTSLVDIATKTILIDILTGTINPLTEGDVELSMYSLSKYASLKGVTLYNTKLTFEDLKSVVGVGFIQPAPKVIAHVNGNHYIVITGIDAVTGEVSYFEANKGSEGQAQTISKGDFLKIWTGYTITKTIPSDLTLLAPSPQSGEGRGEVRGILTDSQAQRVRGSFITILIGIISALIASFTAVVTTVAIAIQAVISGILALIGAIGGFISSLIGGIVNTLGAIGSGLFEGIKFIGGSLFGGLGKLFGGTLFATQASASASTSSFASMFAKAIPAILKTVITIPLNIGITKGLEGLGVNETISSLLSSFVTGGVSGILSGGTNLLTSITSGALSGLTFTGVTELLQKAGLGNSLIDLIALTATKLTSGIASGTIGDIFTTITRDLITDFSMYGIAKFGEYLGIDPRISQLAGIPFASTISGMLNGQSFTQSLISGIYNGITRGITGTAIEWAMDALDINPLVGAVASRAIAGAIEGFLTQSNFLDGAFRGVFKSGIDTLTLGGNITPPYPNDPMYEGRADLYSQAWAQYYYNQSIYLSKVINFSNIVIDDGIVKALETYATGIFHRDTLEAIWRQGGIASLLVGNTIITYNDRKKQTVKRVFTNSGHTDYIDLDPLTDDVVAMKEGNTYMNCEYGIAPDGKPILKNGTKWTTNPNGTTTIDTIQNYRLVTSDLRDGSNNILKMSIPRAGKDRLVIGPNGEILDGVVIDLENGFNYTVAEGKIIEFTDTRFYSADGKYFLKLIDINGKVDVKVGSSGPLTDAESFMLAQLQTYIKDKYIKAVSQQEAIDPNHIKLTFGQNSYAIVDKNNPRVPIEMYANGLLYQGELKAVSGDSFIDRYRGFYAGQSVVYEVLNGYVTYDITSANKINVKIENGLPTRFYYGNSSDSLIYQGEMGDDGRLITGDLIFLQGQKILFANGQPVGYYERNSLELKALDYKTLKGLLTNLSSLNGILEINGIDNNNLEGYPPLWYAIMHDDTVNKWNQLYPNMPINGALLPQFESVLPDWLRAIPSDILKVAANQYLGWHNLTDDAKKHLLKNVGEPGLRGYTMNLTSGGYTSGIQLLNENYYRAYTVTSDSGNIFFPGLSEKIRNPFTKMFVYSYSDKEVPGAGDNNLFKKMKDAGVENIFDTNVIPDAQLIKIKYLGGDHVSYSAPPETNPNNPYYDFYLNVKARSQYAVFDGGDGLREFLGDGFARKPDGNIDDILKDSFNDDWNLIGNGDKIVVINKINGQIKITLENSR